MTYIDDYMELLASEGYRPTKDDERPIIYFKAEGNRYQLQLFEDDKDYLRLTASWNVDDDTFEDIAFRAVSDTNCQLKFAKASVRQDERGVLFSWEALYSEPAQAAAFLERAINQLDAAASFFFKRVAELQSLEEQPGNQEGQ